MTVIDAEAASELDRPSVAPDIGRAASLLTVATLVASIGNYGVNLVAARWLDPSGFGDANLVVTLMLAATAVMVTFQLVTAQRISTAPRGLASVVRREALVRAWRSGACAAVLLAVAAPVIRDLTSSASAIPFVVVAASLPFALAQSVERGVLQGRLAFGPLATSLIVEASVRLVASVGLMAVGAGPVAIAVGIAMSFGGSWVYARAGAVRVDEASEAFGSDDEGGVLADASSNVARATSLLLVGQVLVNNGDVVLAKLLFDSYDAGVYAVVALVGRAVFFLSWSVATAAFPHAARDGSSSRIRRQAIRLVAAICTVSTALVAVLAPPMSGVVFGPAYASAGPLFAPYALATSLFAVANLAATLDAARGRSLGAVVVVGGAICQTSLLVLAADSPVQMVWLQVLAMAGLLAAIGVAHRRRA